MTNDDQTKPLTEPAEAVDRQATSGASTVALGEADIVTLVASAEEFQDPLDGLVERAKVSPAAAFAPEVVQRMGELRGEDRQAYEQLRHDLRRAGVRVAELETEIDAICGRPKPGTSRGGGVVADLLADVDLFHTADGTAYVDVMILGHRETMPVGRSQFREYLTRSWYKQTGESPPSEQLTATIALAEAKAKVDGPTRDVFVRVAGLGGALCVDLGDAAWRAIEITSAGWRVVREPPVRFVRPSGYLALPEPARRGDVTQLKRHLNLAHEGDFVLVVGLVARRAAPDRSLSRACANRRTGDGEVDVHPPAQDARRPQHGAAARSAARGTRSVHRRHPQSCAGLRQSVRPAAGPFGRFLPPRHRRRRSQRVSSTRIRMRCCWQRAARRSSMASRISSVAAI